MLKVEIDAHSGFCGGVIRAISSAEKFLDSNNVTLYSLGAIVHNEEELSRLRLKGLISISDLNDISTESSVLIRAHGEPPKVYSQIEELGLNLIDCTCPVVLKLQKAIREAYLRLKAKGGKVILFGKDGHPEVLGLVGQVDGDVIVVSSLDQLKSLELDYSIEYELFSQTTMSPEDYQDIQSYLLTCGVSLVCHNTICSQVESRHKQLIDFASSHSVIIFVTGKESSNGSVLSGLCRQYNSRTYIIGNENDIDYSWFNENDLVGVCGATSTPKWLLEKVANCISNI